MKQDLDLTSCKSICDKNGSCLENKQCKAKKHTRGVSAGLAEEILLESLLLLDRAEDALVEVLNNEMRIKIEEQACASNIMSKI